MARKGRKVNRRKPSPGRRKTLAMFLGVFILAALVAGGSFLFGKWQMREVPEPEQAKPQAASTPHLPLPPRPEPQQQLSSASVPVSKPEPAVAKAQQGPGKVAIIIDDMGSSMQELQSLLSIKLPVTFSVIPSLGHAKRVAEAAHGAGAEVMVHMPMEPEGYPKQPMEKIGLLVSMPEAEITERVQGYFGTVPYAAGANNHMGSRFTQNAEKMEPVLKVLKERGVFFVDSKTSPKSVGYDKAKALGMRCAARQVFLDNVQDEAAIARQLQQVAAIARKKGSAIAIGHPHPATIHALQTGMPELAASGITFVYTSKIVKGER